MMCFTPSPRAPLWRRGLEAASRIRRQATAALLAITLLAAQSSVAGGAPQGAFGLRFGESVNPVLLGAPAGIVVAREPLGQLAQLHWDRPEEMPPAWREFAPPTIPAALRGLAARFQVLLDEGQRPLRIRVSTVALAGACEEWMVRLHRLLSARYSTNDSVAGTRPGFVPSRVYGDQGHWVELTCSTDGDLGLLEYTDVDALRGWQMRERPRIETWYASLLREAVDMGGLGLRGAFGIAWHEPSPLATGVPDLDQPITPPRPFVRMPGAEYTAMFSPDGHPIAVRAHVCLPGGRSRALMKLLSDALRAHRGTLLKNTPEHVVLRVGDDLLSVRVPEAGCVNLAATDGDAQRHMLARREAARLARAERLRLRQEAAERGL